MQKVRKIPRRQCVGCREMKDKAGLVRVVRSPEGAVELDLSGRRNGRGAYLCRSGACLQRARKSRALERALSAAVAPEVYETLAAQMGGEP